jgi:superfamily I DNA/RNA helicase
MYSSLFRLIWIWPSYLNKVKNSFCILFQENLDAHSKNIKQAIESYEGIGQVKLMTILYCKGLEFNTVFFVDFHDESWWGLRRAIQKGNKQAQLEEKNSFFVGLSRAEERLFFTKGQGNWPPLISSLLKDSQLLTKMLTP